MIEDRQPIPFAIETRGLTRRYGSLVAVDDLNLAVHAGSIFGLIGPNGASKTTTLRMLAGLQEPSSGEIIFGGQRANGDWDHFRRQIGYMPDFFGVYEDMLVWEYLDFFARCYNLPAARRRQIVDELLDLVDLAHKREDYVESLSRGMRQRLCLAHALVHDPKVLLLDEPASGLDPRARVEMRELLRELGAMGKTVLVSSHILSELAELCDALGIIEGGKLVASGPMAQLMRHAREGWVLQIKLLSDPDAARSLLSSQPGVGKIVAANGDAAALEVDFLGDDHATAALLSTLVAGGHQILSFTESRGDLEEVFLRLTRGAEEE